MLQKMTGEKKGQKQTGRGFTLVEVLVALAMAALGFGVILHSVGLQLSLVSSCLERHQMLLSASQILESRLASGQVEDDVTEEELEAAVEGEQGEDATEALVRYTYSLTTHPVTADPRVQQVTAMVKGPNGPGIRLSAYRLRVKRD